MHLSFSILISFAAVTVALLAVAAAHDGHQHHPGCGHHHHDHLDHHHHDHLGHHHHGGISRGKLPEEIAEEEDLKLVHLDHRHHHDLHLDYGDNEKEQSAFGLWMQAMGCSMLVSMASLVCLIIVPVFFLRGKPSKAVVDSLAVFGAGAMLGDAFLHQLPHAFGGEHSHSHDHHDHHDLQFDHADHGHSHSLKDLSVGLSVLSGIVLFLIVEKVVRYVEECSGEEDHDLHSHHHHHHKKSLKPKAKEDRDNSIAKDKDSLDKDTRDTVTDGKFLDPQKKEPVAEGSSVGPRGPRKRASASGATAADEKDISVNGPKSKELSLNEISSSSSLVFGYLNLFSDGVHNFTDGMALGSAFLLYGTVGGWSRTLFLLAHELPQEVGDFGILVRSGFSVSKALLFNFLSALVALAGTAMALVLGKDPGQSSLIEGFTAGGFIYIAVAGVLPELNNGSTSIKGTLLQITSLLMGMGVALCISLVE